MKKFLIVILMISSLFIFTGCDTTNTPTKRTEEYLSKYKGLDENVKSDIDLMTETENLSADNGKTYKKVIERQLSDMKYEIVSEEINGDKATVTAKITVYDLNKSKKDTETYYKTNPEEFFEDNTLNEDKYSEYQLKQMLEYSKTVDYTIEIDLTKVDDIWTVNDVDNTIKEKIYGLYDYEK